MDKIQEATDKFNKLHEMALTEENIVLNLRRAKTAEKSELQRILAQKEEAVKHLESLEVSEKDAKDKTRQAKLDLSSTANELSDKRKELKIVHQEVAEYNTELGEKEKEGESLDKENAEKRKTLKVIGEDISVEKNRLKIIIQKAKEVLTL